MPIGNLPLPAPAFLPILLALAGCTDPSEPPVHVPDGTAATAPAAGKADSVSAPENSIGPASANSHRSPEAVIRAYYQAIGEGEFATAYRLWDDSGNASGQSFSAFREGFAATRESEVEITGPVRTEGAAGSLYATVPVEVSATLKDGTRQHFTGNYVLRRANDVPGATAQQLRWHIESASLRPG